MDQGIAGTEYGSRYLPYDIWHNKVTENSTMLSGSFRGQKLDTLKSTKLYFLIIIGYYTLPREVSYLQLELQGRVQ